VTSAVPADVERLLLRAAREVRPLAALTPVDPLRERLRLVALVRSGRRALPRWTYAPMDHEDLRRALVAAERVLERGLASAVDHLVLGRIRELSIEAALCAAAGTRQVASLALERFAPANAALARAASSLRAAWLALDPRRDEAPSMASDDPHPKSLLSQMRAAVGGLRLPFAVIPTRGLAALAATGDRTIYVAVGRQLAPEDAARTVLHEIEGHARPRARAALATCALFRAGTARGTDDQEGRALLLEERAGFLAGTRRRQLAARHWAVEAMLAGASFADVARALVDDHGFDAAEAVLIAERAFRGGDGASPGLGRERIYLESLVRMRAHLAKRPEDERVLAYGQVAIDAVEPLRAFVPRDAE
jgi:hypothetical protein